MFKSKITLRPGEEPIPIAFNRVSLFHLPLSEKATIAYVSSLGDCLLYCSRGWIIARLFFTRADRRRLRRCPIWRSICMGSFLKSPVVNRPDAPASDIEMAQQFPALLEYMTSLTLPDGSPRRTSTLLVFCEDGCWKACLTDRGLTDRDPSASLWRASDTFMGVLSQLDDALRVGVQDWRVRRFTKR